MMSSVDPVRDMEIIKTELILKDLEILAKHKARVEKGAKAGDKKAGSQRTRAGRAETTLRTPQLTSTSSLLEKK